MRNKAPLALMEQLVMVLVFALAAALCVQAFVLADNRSREMENRDRALLEAQNAVETLKSCGGDYRAAAQLCRGTWEDTAVQVFYDEAWQTVEEDRAVYTLTIAPAASGHPLLGRAEVLVYETEGGQLCTLPAAWQEVDAYA